MKVQSFTRRTAGFVLAASLVGMAMGVGCAHTHKTPAPPAAVPPTKPDHEHAVETGIPVASTPQGLMREGAEESIQRRLESKGFLSADECAKGQLDQATREGLRKYQKREGLPPTGLPSYETVRHLGLRLDAIFHTTTRPQEPAPR